eukprot:1985771-Prymnesium_polylepis.2
MDKAVNDEWNTKTICALTLCTGLSLAESIAHAGATPATKGSLRSCLPPPSPPGLESIGCDNYRPCFLCPGRNEEGVGKLIGRATSFFSYAWQGMNLGSMLDALEVTIDRLSDRTSALDTFGSVVAAH